MRRRNDAYYTSSWCVDRLIETGCIWLDGDALEPCAGDGSIVRAVDRHKKDHGLMLWTTMDIDPSVDVDIHGDFLTMDIRKRFDFIITNPPYRQAEKFAKKGLEIAGQVVMLLRLNWLASQKRSEFFASYGCPDAYVLPNRIDGTEYAWFHWHLGTEKDSPGKLSILATTPRSERCCG